MKLQLTKRICDELRLRVRARAEQPLSNYKALHRIAALLDEADETSRGLVVNLDAWPADYLEVLREALMAALADCVQMQVRRALAVRIAQLDDHLDVSAVERLGRLPP